MINVVKTYDIHEISIGIKCKKSNIKKFIHMKNKQPSYIFCIKEECQELFYSQNWKKIMLISEISQPIRIVPKCISGSCNIFAVIFLEL